MRNKQPIFIVGFARGGTNILQNLLQSHPRVCVPRGETHQVFKGQAHESYALKALKLLRYAPMVLLERKDVLSKSLWEPRKPFHPWTECRLDRVLAAEKLRATEDGQNYWKDPRTRYTRGERREARLLSKNLDGLIFLSREFARMYPDATFIALIRNGFAVCEGNIRRGGALETIAKNYQRACEQIIEDSRVIPRYHIVRYEDLIAEPQNQIRKIFEWADLDISELKEVRLETKAVMEADGRHRFVQAAAGKELRWYHFDEISSHFRQDANDNQLARLSEAQKKEIVSYCRKSLSEFGYLPATPESIGHVTRQETKLRFSQAAGQ